MIQATGSGYGKTRKANDRPPPSTSLFLLGVLALLLLLSSGLAARAQLVNATTTLSLEITGGPSLVVQQAFPTSVDVIGFPPAEEEPLVIYAALTNTGTEDLIGIPSSTYFYTTPESSFFLSGVVAVIDDEIIYEGDGLREMPASHPFLGGFVLAPGETRVFVLHIIYGLLCPGCENIPGPLVVPAPIGEVLTITGSSLDIQLGEIIDGVVVADPNTPPEIRILANAGAFPLTVTVISGAVGGIPELPQVAGAPLEASDSSGTNVAVIAGIAAGAAAAASALGGAAWWVRKRLG